MLSSKYYRPAFIIFISIVWGQEILERQGWKNFIIIPIILVVVVLFINRNNELKATLYEEGIVSRKTAEEFLSGKAYIRSEQNIWFYDGLRDINEYFYGKMIHTKIIPERERIKYISEEKKLEILSLGFNLDVNKGEDLRKNVIIR